MDAHNTFYNRLFGNEAIANGIIESLKEGRIYHQPSVRSVIPIETNSDLFSKAALENISSGKFAFSKGEEAIILQLGRPVLEIQNNDVSENEPELGFWKAIVEKCKGNELSKVIKAIGRIELSNHPSFEWIGTGWLVQDDLIITNRHVAEIFCRKSSNSFLYRKNPFGEKYDPSIDFREEIGSDKSDAHELLEVLHIEPANGHDLAVLRVKWGNNNDKRESLKLADIIAKDKTIATIGYPARDSRTTIHEDQQRIFSNIFNKKRMALGEVTLVSNDKGMLIHDCCTLGGNSGSPIIDLESKEVLGLHFAGRELHGNYAVTANAVSKIIKSIRYKSSVTVPDIDGISSEIPSLASMKNRSGYNESFLNQKVHLPALSPSLKEEVAKVKECNDGVLKYANYSVVMSAEKRLALLTAVNIDGSKWRHIYRGNDVWKLDPRIKRDHQVGNELYKGNDLDRGHLVRRLDPAWGDTFDQAEFASLDTFFYTNCSPQHKNLNQKTWLGLEEYILSNTDKKDMKVSVFNGPVFSDDDTIYRDIQIPDSFWKVVVANSGNEKIRTTAYLLSQGKWLTDLEFRFGQYKTFQVPLSLIEELTGIQFEDHVKESDALKTREERILSTYNLINTMKDIKL